MFRERERLGAHHVANDAFNFLEVSEHDMQQEQYENIKKLLEYVYNFKHQQNFSRSSFVKII